MVEFEDGLLEAARKLMRADGGRSPSQAELRHAASTAYYALFHFVSRSCALALLGGGAKNLTRAKEQIYRSLDHRDIVFACQRARREGIEFPQGIRKFSDTCLELYHARIAAYYVRDGASDFPFNDAQHLIEECESAMSRINDCSLGDRRAFAVLAAIKSKAR